jgi:hypothetical protein
MSIHSTSPSISISKQQNWLNLQNIVFLLGISLLIFLAYLGWNSVSNQSVRELIIGNLKAKNELASVEVSVSATVKESQENKLFFIPLGSTHVIYEGNGKIVAGIDMNAIEVKDSNPANHYISIVLPPPHLVEKFLDVNSSNLVDSYTLWYGADKKAELLDKAQKSALSLIISKACNQEIFAAANNNAQILITKILTKVGYKTINIKTQNPTDCNASSL